MFLIETIDGQNSQETNFLSKRKRKVPLKHRDFSLITKDEDSDPDIDEILFKRAKIEYTNVDGSKVGFIKNYFRKKNSFISLKINETLIF